LISGRFSVESKTEEPLQAKCGIMEKLQNITTCFSLNMAIRTFDIGSSTYMETISVHLSGEQACKYFIIIIFLSPRIRNLNACTDLRIMLLHL
jgi:hypothetical protein